MSVIECRKPYGNVVVCEADLKTVVVMLCRHW